MDQKRNLETNTISADEPQEPATKIAKKEESYNDYDLLLVLEENALPKPIFHLGIFLGN